MIRICNVKIRVDLNQETARIKKVMKLLHIKKEDLIEVKIQKQSIDARNKKDVYYVYELLVKVKNEEDVLKKNHSQNIFKDEIKEDSLPILGNLKLTERIIIVGSGPAGLFAAYYLAKFGYKPLIIERGKRVEERIQDVENFWETNKLNPESNVQFGEGGAGTFSDGKLNTLVKDKENLIGKVFQIFVENGAPEEILYIQNPHIGTDNLREVIKNMRGSIIKMGGEFRYQTKLTNLIIKDKKLEAIEINGKETIPTHNLILAIGHSARDTFQMLVDNQLDIVSKPFAVGIRIMHHQDLINENQYGSYASFLPPANYKLTYTTIKRRGVYSFCMCPGGYVVNASSEIGRLVINGMSNYKRDTKVANSAIIVTISKDDFGNNPLAGLVFQKDLEEKAYKCCKGKIPIQLWKDFQSNKISSSFGSLNPVTKGSYEFANLRDIFPNYINEALLEAIPNFSKKIKNFDDSNTILAGVETRTSSPIRILRDENYEANIKGIYPCGEGSGYAGGITTSAMDGIKVALSLIKKYKP